MDAPTSPEFRRRAVELARQRDKPIAQADIDEGKREGLSSDEGEELVELRRQKRFLETGVEILKRASADFARENVLPR